MAKQIKLTYEGKEYTLEFNRKTVKTMERNGFRLEDVSNKPNLLVPQLFAGAFQAHHRSIKPDIPEAIFEHITDKEGLMEALVDMYVEPAKALFDEPEEGAEGNISWTKVE